jgi:DNA polymerase III subunit epsilon
MRLRSPRHGAAAAFSKAARAADSTAWDEARWCAIDLELTGLDPRKDVIIAIGAVPIEHGRVLLGQSIYTLVRTSRRSEHAAVLMHKLRVADLADAPPLEEATDLLFDALAGRVPVFHTAAVERNFLGPVFAQRRVRLPRAADTDILGRLWLRQQGQSGAARLPLERLASMLGLATAPAHHALGDALTTATVFVALATHLGAVEQQTVGSLVWADERLRGPRRLGAS